MRTAIPAVAVALLLAACTGGDDTQSATPSPPEPSVATGLQAFCTRLEGFAAALQADLGGTADTVSAVQDDAGAAARALREDAAELDGEAAQAANEAIHGVQAVSDWKPDDAASLDDLISGAQQAVGSFSDAHC